MDDMLELELESRRRYLNDADFAAAVNRTIDAVVPSGEGEVTEAFRVLARMSACLAITLYERR